MNQRDEDNHEDQYGTMVAIPDVDYGDEYGTMMINEEEEWL